MRSFLISRIFLLFLLISPAAAQAQAGQGRETPETEEQAEEQAGEEAEEQDSHGVILVYHHVATDTPPSTSISPADFRAHLDYLRDNGFSVVSLARMIEALRNNDPLPDKAVAITFDDGYISIHDTAFPLLQDYGFPFTLFLSTGPIDRGQRGYMNWEQIREMAMAGVIIANHTVEHGYMVERREVEGEGERESEEQWLARQESELLTAERRIAEETGQSHRYLAYPYGEFNPALKSLLDTHGFTGLAQNSGAVNAHSDFLALPRFPVASIYANLETARIKFASKAFNVSLAAPSSPVTTVRNPEATLQFGPGDYDLERIACFAGGRPLPVEWLDRDNRLLKLAPTETYAGRRWLYTCTAPAPEAGRFYWYSAPWIYTGN